MTKPKDKSVINNEKEKRIEFSDVGNRWRQLFQQYGASMGMEGLMGAYGNWSKSNPFIQNRRIKNSSFTPEYFDEEALAAALRRPEESEDILRAMSAWLYYTNYVYQTLVKLDRDTPRFNYTYLPLYIDNQDDNKMKADSIFIDKLLKKFKVNETFKTIANQVSIEGKCSYLVRTSFDKKNPDFLILQKLDPKHVKITGFSSIQKFTVSFDFAIFCQPGYNIDLYPQFFKDTYNKMVEEGFMVPDQYGGKKLNINANLPKGWTLENDDSRYFLWVKLPPGLCWTFFRDGAHPNALPEMAGLFPDFASLDNYRWLAGQLESKAVSSVMTAEVPLVADGNLKPGADQTALSTDVIMGYTSLWNDMISSNIEAFFAPFSGFKLHELSNQPESLDIIYSKTRDLIAASGQTALLSLDEKPSIAATKAAEQIKEAACDYLSRQFEGFLNETLKTYNLNYDWTIKIYGGIFSWRDDVVGIKEMILNGAKGLIPKYLGYYDLTVEDFKGGQQLVDLYDINFLMDKKQEEADIITDSTIKTASANTQVDLQKEQEKEDEKINSNSVGRPTIPDKDVDNDNTDKSRNQGGNVSENKE